MAQLSMNLMVHGVPQGQKMWGVDDNDRRYLATFYGRKWDANELMLVEIMNLGSGPICYYSYVIGNNVCAADGRAGSYFALTLKINTYYADLENMFNILKAAYKKMCVGLCVSDNGGVVKYLIKDFADADAKIKNIEKNVIGYIGEYSNNSDLLSLQGFTANSTSGAACVSLLECNLSNVLPNVKSTGKIAVSPEYPDNKTAKILKAKDEEIAKVKNQAKQEIEETRKNAELSVSQIRQKSQADLSALRQSSEETLLKTTKDLNAKLAAAQTDADARVDAIKAKYADVDAKIKAAKDEKDEWKNKYNDIHKAATKLEKELDTYKVKYERLKQQLNSVPASTGEPAMVYQDEEEEIRPSLFKIIRKFLPFINCILLIVIIVFSVINTCTSPEKEMDSTEEGIEIEEKPEFKKGTPEKPDYIRKNIDNSENEVQKLETVEHEINPENLPKSDNSTPATLSEEPEQNKNEEKTNE